MATRTIFDCDRCKTTDLKFPIQLKLISAVKEGEMQKERMDLCLVCAQDILQSLVGDFDPDTTQRFIKAVRETPAVQSWPSTRVVTKPVLQQQAES